MVKLDGGNRILSKIFRFDPRSFKLFTILLGLATLWDAFTRFPEASSFYTSNGVLTDFYFKNLNQNQWIWSLNLINRDLAFQQLLILFQTTLSLLLIAGFHRPLINLLLWVLVLSRQVANPFTLSAGDELLRFLLFWLIFIPAAPLSSKKTYAGGIALGIQLLSVYFFSAVMKTGAPWREDGTAISLAFKIESFSLPLARELLNFPELLKYLTFSTLYLEAFLPLLFILTAISGYARLALVSVMILFHLALACTFRLGFFPFVSIASWTLWLPEVFWKKLCRRAPIQSSNELESNSSTPFRKLMSGVCLYLSFFCIGINFNTSKERPFNPGSSLESIGHALQLWQRWTMFAPMPSVDDGWNQFEGVLKNGERILINGYGGLNDGELIESLNQYRPVDLGASYRSGGWKKFLLSLHQSETTDAVRESYLDYLCHQTRIKNTNLDLDRIEFFYNVEWTKPDLSKLNERVLITDHGCKSQ